ncbi:MAG: Rne/Rng family ribonuclease [Verrucomicrobia bacterium]|nr:Rne/Rng family ribonuclease [Verrucomicrobiota bacterium]
MGLFSFLRRKKSDREIIINAESVETRVAVSESGRLEEFLVEHASKERIVGSIFKGRIQNLEHELQAAFVNIGLNKNAFLHYWDMVPDGELQMEIEEGAPRRRQSRWKRISNDEVEKRFPPGTEIVVQVTKGAIGTKGPRVTANLSLPGRYLVMVPGTKLKGVSRKIDDDQERHRLKKTLARLPTPPGVGLIVRTAAGGGRQSSLVRDLKGLLDVWNNLQAAIRDKPAPCCVYREPDIVERVVRDWLTEDVDRIVIDNREHFERIRDLAGRISRQSRSRVYLYEGEAPIFEHYSVERQIEAAFRRTVALHSGGAIVLDETEALIAIDVNTGRHKGRGHSQEDAILEVNTEAVEEVARQLRLRNIGGIVVIDLIDMKSRKHQQAVYRTMKEALKRDRARTNVLPISELGLLEMTRQRVEESLSSSLNTDCPYCHGRGYVKSALGTSVEIQRQISAIMRKRRGAVARKLQIVVHPTVMERLRREDEQFLLDIQKRFEGELAFKSDSTKHMEFFAIHDGVTNEVLFSNKDR